MPIFCLEERNIKILFVHIPKTGGGSVEHFFRGNGFQVHLFSIDPSFISFFKCSPQHMHASMLTELLNIDNFDYCFTIFRNPLDRILSEYRWRVRHPWSANGFDGWYLKVRSEREKNPYLFDNHLRPQCDFLIPNIKMFSFDLGFSKIFNVVAEDMGLKWDASAVINQKSNRRINQIQHDSRLLDLYQKAFISPQMEKIISGDYSQDFRVFNRVASCDYGSLQYDFSPEGA